MIWGICARGAGGTVTLNSVSEISGIVYSAGVNGLPLLPSMTLDRKGHYLLVGV
jgi:hypothetical protein